MIKFFMSAVLLLFAMIETACTDDGASAPDTICFDDVIAADDVGPYSIYRDYYEEFLLQTGCKSNAGCTKTMKIHRCVDNVEFK